MPNNEIPAMPDPNSRPEKPKAAPADTPSPRATKPATPDEGPIRLEPVIDKETDNNTSQSTATQTLPDKEPATERSSPPVEAPQSTGFPTKLRPEPTAPDDDEEESPTMEPVTSEASWNNDLLNESHNTATRPKLALMAACGVVAILIGIVVWNILNNDQQEMEVDTQASTNTRQQAIEQPEWESDAREVLSKYLAAEAEGDLNQRFRMVTYSRETQALLPQFKPRRDAADVVRASAFVAKPLPKSFTDNGIFLMYYQRPDTLPEDAIFRPLIPVRVRLAIDAPSFLEISAKSGYLQTRNRQNICAFFKRGKDDRLTLDWPVFVQTRNRLVEKFTTHPHREARQVFRLMVHKVQPTLIKNVYRQHLAHHDWYHVHCPGYDKETHVVAVAKNSAAGKIMKHRFDQGASHGQTIHAITAELAWSASEKDSSPVLSISGIVCWEFYNLNSAEPTKTAPKESK